MKSKKGILDKKVKSCSNEFKPYDCGLCGAKFLDKGNGELHLERIHNTRQSLWLQTSKCQGFSCLECNVWFNEHAHLRQHQMQEHPEQNHASNSEIASQSTSQIPAIPAHPQYYFQSLQHLPAFTHNQMHQFPCPSQIMPQIPSQLPPIPPITHISSQLPHLQLSPSQTVFSPTISTSEMMSSASKQPPVTTVLSENTTTVPQSTVINPIEVSKVAKSKTAPSNSKHIKYICKECGLKFVDIMNLELHTQRKHSATEPIERMESSESIGIESGSMSDKKNKSRRDKSIENNIENVKNKSHTLKTKYICLVCENSFNSMNLLICHLQDIHSSSNANLIKVAKNSEKKSVMEDIASDDENLNMTVTCEICFKTFSNKTEFVTHLKKERTNICGFCKYKSCSFSKVLFHIDSNHSESENLSCSLCSFAFASAQSFLEHIEFHKKKGISLSFKCLKCNSTAESYKNIKSHLDYSHTGELVNVSLSIKNLVLWNCYIYVLKLSSVTRTQDEKCEHEITEESLSFSELLYSCSKCKTFIPNVMELEKHISIHIPSNSKYFSKHKTKHIPEKFSVNPLSQAKNTLEFRCKECGFWKNKSKTVLEHIQKMHLSGHLIHKIKLKSGVNKELIVNVFTPLSGNNG